MQGKLLLLKIVTVFCLSLMLGSAEATTLTSNATVDNQLRIYLSTDDAFGGFYLGDAANMDDWTKISSYTSLLDSGVDYYLHVHGHDTGGVSGFLGEFWLDSTDHVFANGTDHLLTNTTDWSGNFTGWGDSYSALTDYGNTATWWYFGGVTGISADARWIWAGGDGVDGNPLQDDVYFSTKISATTTSPVPEPVTMFLMSLGLVGIAGIRRRKK